MVEKDKNKSLWSEDSPTLSNLQRTKGIDINNPDLSKHSQNTKQEKGTTSKQISKFQEADPTPKFEVFSLKKRGSEREGCHDLRMNTQQKIKKMLVKETRQVTLVQKGLSITWYFHINTILNRSQIITTLAKRQKIQLYCSNTKIHFGKCPK